MHGPEMEGMGQSTSPSEMRSVSEARQPRCPVCGSRLEYRNIRLNRSFQCGSCKECLSVPESYYSWFRWVCTILAFPLCWVLGFRSLTCIIRESGTPNSFFESGTKM